MKPHIPPTLHPHIPPFVQHVVQDIYQMNQESSSSQGIQFIPPHESLGDYVESIQRSREGDHRLAYRELVPGGYDPQSSPSAYSHGDYGLSYKPPGISTHEESTIHMDSEGNEYEEMDLPEGEYGYEEEWGEEQEEMFMNTLNEEGDPELSVRLPLNQHYYIRRDNATELDPEQSIQDIDPAYKQYDIQQKRMLAEESKRFHERQSILYQQQQLHPPSSTDPPSQSLNPHSMQSPNTRQRSAMRSQKMNEMMLLLNAQTSNMIQTIRTETGDPFENIGFQLRTSLETLSASEFPNRVDHNHETMLRSLRSGYGDLSLGERCRTCKTYKGLDDPPCTGHKSHINKIIPTVQSTNMNKFEASVRSMCSNGSEQLLLTGAVSRTIDRIVGLDPLQPIPLTPLLRQWFVLIDYELPDWMPQTIDHVMALKREVHDTKLKWNSAQIEFMFASQQRNQKQTWPRKDKLYYNQAWKQYQEASEHLFGKYKKLLILLPCNLISFYNEHEEYGYQLNREWLRILKFKSDTFQNNKLGLIKADSEQRQLNERELLGWNNHQNFLQAEIERWKARQSVFKRILAYLETYIQEKRDRFNQLLGADKVEDFIQTWKFCKVKTEGWTLEESARWIQETQEKQWARQRARRVQLDKKEKKKEEKKAGERAKGGSKESKESYFCHLDQSWSTYDFPNFMDDPDYERPPIDVKADCMQLKGDIYCSLYLGGCGSHQCIPNSRRLAFTFQYTEETENWHRLYYPFFRDLIYVSPTYLLGMLRRAIISPFNRKQRWESLEKMGFKVYGTRPEAFMNEHLLVIPWYLRRLPTALTQTAKVAKQHWTTCYLHIMAEVQAQLGYRKKFHQMLDYLPLSALDREEHEIFMKQNPPAVSSSISSLLPSEVGDFGSFSNPMPPDESKSTGPSTKLLSETEQLREEEKALLRVWNPDQEPKTPFYWILHYGHATQQVPWPSYLAEQQNMMEAGLIEPMWLALKNAGHHMQWHDWSFKCFGVDFMFTIVGSLWHPLTYRAIKNNPATELINRQSSIQLHEFEIASTPKIQPIPIGNDLKTKFMSWMDDKDQTSNLLLTYLPPNVLRSSSSSSSSTVKRKRSLDSGETSSKKETHVDISESEFSTTLFKPKSKLNHASHGDTLAGQYYVTTALQELILRDVRLNTEEMKNIGRDESASSMKQDQFNSFNKNLVKEKTQSIRKPASKIKQQNNNTVTIETEICNKKDRMFSMLFQRWIKDTGRLTANIDYSLAINEVRIGRQILRQMLDKVDITKDNIEFYQEFVDETAVLRNLNLKVKLAMRKQDLDRNEQRGEALKKKVNQAAAMGTGTVHTQDIVYSKEMWVSRSLIPEVEYATMSQKEKEDYHKDEIYPAAMQIVRLPHVAGKLELFDLRSFYNRNQRTPEKGDKKAFTLSIGDSLVFSRPEGPPNVINRPPTLHMLGIASVTILEGEGYVFYINPILFSIFNGDFDGDKGLIVQVRTAMAILECLTLMNPNININDSKSAFNIIGLMQDSNNAMAYMSTRPNDRWYASQLTNFFLFYKRMMAHKSRTLDPKMKRPLHTTDFSLSYITRVRQMFLRKFKALVQAKKGLMFANSFTQEQYWKTVPELRPYLKEVYLTNAEMQGALFPESFHYIRYEGEDPRNPVRIEIKDNVCTGIWKKQDIGGDHSSIIKELYNIYGPDITAEFINNASHLGIPVNPEKGFNINQYDYMKSVAARTKLWKYNQSIAKTEAHEYKEWEGKTQQQLKDRVRFLTEWSRDTEEAILKKSLKDLTVTRVRYDQHPQLITMQLNHEMTIHNSRTFMELNNGIRTRVNQFPHQWAERRSKVTDKVMKEEASFMIKKFQRLSQDPYNPPYYPGFCLIPPSDSGAKGNIGKWMTLALYPGLQLIDGALEKRTYGNRINYYLDEHDHRIQSFGFIAESYGYGLPPDELMLQKGACHKQVFDSSGSVNVTGKASKENSKMMGDEFIDTNLSVRDHCDAMIQLYYNSDGMDPSRGEQVICWMDMVFVTAKAKLTSHEVSRIPDRRELEGQVHSKWMASVPAKSQMSEEFWTQTAPYLDSFWGGHVVHPRSSSLSAEAKTWEVASHHEEFRVLMHAFWRRQTALQKCIRPPNLVIQGEIQCVNIPRLCRHIKAHARYKARMKASRPDETRMEDEIKEESPITAYALLNRVRDLRYVLWQLDKTWQMMGKKGDLFNPDLSVHHSLDWYLLENLCYAKIVGEYAMTESQVEDLMGAIITKWYQSRIPQGIAIGIIAVQSVYTDQTQGMLNKKHMDKTTMSELTKGPKRWNQLLENALMVVRDHLIIADMAFYSKEEDRKWVQACTGYELWTDTHQCGAFKEVNMYSILPSFTFERWTRAPKEGVTSRECPNIWKRICHSFQQFDSYPHPINSPEAQQGRITYYSLGSPDGGDRKAGWISAPISFPRGFIRFVINTELATKYGMNWKIWLSQFRLVLTNTFFMYTFHYQDLNVVVVHIFKVQLVRPEEDSEEVKAYEPKVKPPKKNAKPRKPTKKKPKPNELLAKFDKEIHDNVAWSKIRIDSKLKSSSVIKSRAKIHVYENEAMCIYYYIRSLLTHIFQGVKVKNIDTEDLPANWMDNRPIQPVASRLIRQLDPSTVTYRRVTLNIQHNEMSEILAYIHQFVIRPDVDPYSLILIHPAHVFQMFGIVATRNITYLECRTVNKDMGSAVLGCHTMLVVDSVTKTGNLIHFNTTQVEELNSDVLTLASHRKTLWHIIDAAVKSKRANKNAGSTQNIISAPFKKGTNFFSSRPIRNESPSASFSSSISSSSYQMDTDSF